MSVAETLLIQSLSGMLWAVFSAQPLIIQAATGPVLIFEKSLCEICDFLEADVFTMRLWASIWMLMMCVAAVAFQGATVLKYVTRFTEDVFATLISIIFIGATIRFLQEVSCLIVLLTHLSGFRG